MPYFYFTIIVVLNENRPYTHNDKKWYLRDILKSYELDSDTENVISTNSSPDTKD